MKTLILDNYDSFTFNLYQGIGALGGKPVVIRNDATTVGDVQSEKFTHIVVGPGPGNPYTKRDIGISDELLRFAEREKIPFLGVCLGHQVMGVVFGGRVVRAPSPCHGRASTIQIEKPSPIFRGLGKNFAAMRYHSLCVEQASIPETLRVTAMSDDGVVMAMEHVSLPIYGMQFHPESIGTPVGQTIFENFLAL
jgi:anthranilate synthase/aminodeoxychorismate synthase-like glutamine amidotransferase